MIKTNPFQAICIKIEGITDFDFIIRNAEIIPPKNVIYAKCQFTNPLKKNKLTKFK